MWHKENTGMRKKIKGIAKAVLALSMCLVMPMTAIPATAAGNEFPDLDRTGSISITYKYYNENTGKTEPVSGGNSVGLFKVADAVIDNGYKFKADERFASAGEIPATSEELDAVNVDLADAMAEIAMDYDFDIAPKETDANGQVSFEGLEVTLHRRKQMQTVRSALKDLKSVCTLSCRQQEEKERINTIFRLS